MVATSVVISLPWPRSTLVERIRTAITTYKIINQGNTWDLVASKLHHSLRPSRTQTEYELQLPSKIYNVHFQQITLYLTYI
jgi:hypothetical protein